MPERHGRVRPIHNASANETIPFAGMRMAKCPIRGRERYKLHAAANETIPFAGMRMAKSLIRRRVRYKCLSETHPRDLKPARPRPLAPCKVSLNVELGTVVPLGTILREVNLAFDGQSR